jgi:hypothetical protein
MKARGGSVHTEPERPRDRRTNVIVRSALHITIILAVAAVVATMALGCGPTGETAPTSSSFTTAMTPSQTGPAVNTTSATGSSSQETDAALFPIMVDGKWGYIDRQGGVVVDPRFDDAKPFREGLGCIRVGDEETGKYGFIDATGRVVIEPAFAMAAGFSEGLCRTRLTQTGEQGYINKTGAWVIEPRFRNAGQFSEGLAPVQLEGSDLTGCIDRMGTFVIEPKYREYLSFSEGLAVAEKSTSVSVGRVETTKGYLDRSGSWAIEPRFPEAERFSEGLALVMLPEETGEDFAFIDTSGNVVFTLDRPQGETYDYYPFFSEGRAVWYGEDGRAGFVDSTGSFAIAPEFVRVRPFSEGLAAASMDAEGNWGYIDKNGAWAIEPQFAFAYPFADGLAPVTFATADGLRAGYIDHAGKVIWQRP